METTPLITRWRLAFFVLLLVSAVIYLPALSGQPVWDDHAILSGIGIGGGESLWACFSEPFNFAYFRPLTSVSYYLDLQAFGRVPFFFHQTNILLHVASVAVVVGIALRVFESKWLALLAGALFAFHPARVSSVAWIGGRTDVLSTLFLAVFCYGLIGWFKAEGPAKQVNLVLGGLGFAAALFAKEQSLAVWPLVPISVACFSKSSDRLREGVWLSMGFLIIAAVFVGLWLANYPNPAQAEIQPFGYQMTLAGFSVIHYALLFFAPNGLGMHAHTLESYKWTGWIGAASGWLLFAGAAYLAWRLLRQRPQLGFFAAFALLAYLPISNLIPIPSLLVGSYRVAVMGVPVAVLMAAAVGYLASAPRSRAAKLSTSGVVSAFVMLCLGLSYWGASRWQSERAYFSAVCSQDERSITGKVNLALALMNEGRHEEAAKHASEILSWVCGPDWRRFRKFYDDLPSHPEVLQRVSQNKGSRSEAYGMLSRMFNVYGTAQSNLGNEAEAVSALEVAVLLDNWNADANLNLARMLSSQDRRRSMKHLGICIAVEPNNAAALSILGSELLKDREFGRAAYYLKRATVRKSLGAGPFLDLCEAELEQRNLKKAREALAQADKVAVFSEELLARKERLRNRLARIEFGTSRRG